MAREVKTKPTDASVEAFLAAVPDPQRRADGIALKAMMEEISGAPAILWGPSIVGFGRYQSPSGPWPLIGFSPRKADLVLYIMPGFAGVAELLARLGKHRLGKSCLYLKRLSDHDPEALRGLIAASLAAMRARHGA